VSPLNLLTRLAALEAGFDRLTRRLDALEAGKPAFPPRRGRPPGSKNRPKPIANAGVETPPRDRPEAIPS
jgi:hypothetical protein